MSPEEMRKILRTMPPENATIAQTNHASQAFFAQRDADRKEHKP